MSKELRIVTIDWETRHDYHDLRFSIFIVSAFVSSVQELQCLSWSNTSPPHVLVDSGSYLSWFGCGSLSPTETWVKQIFLFLPMHCNWNLLFCWPSNSAPKIPYIIELSQIPAYIYKLPKRLNMYIFFDALASLPYCSLTDWLRTPFFRLLMFY